MKHLQDFLTSHDIRHQDLAFMTGCTTRTIYNWVEGVRPLPRSVELLLLALEEKKIDEKWLAKKLKRFL